jgi:hypothetical protein
MIHDYQPSRVYFAACDGCGARGPERDSAAAAEESVTAEAITTRTGWRLSGCWSRCGCFLLCANCADGELGKEQRQ